MEPWTYIMACSARHAPQRRALHRHLLGDVLHLYPGMKSLRGPDSLE